ncbi:hypothetical protein [Pseudomonas sp. UFMG81]|uniref:hypothetical protein n=1 Tax=Pseudomonas sp. UFMG81 TaxID=2745936 RepID=UPI00188E6563|nr:hypothetical protein [Pseudomonas sp. UFMG81]
MDNDVPDAVERWMLSDPEQLGWDMIIALPFELINRGIRHDDLRRHREGLVIQGLNGSDQYEGLTYSFEGYRLTTTVLALHEITYDNPRINVQMHLTGGVSLLSDAGGEIIELAEHGPLTGYRAQMEVRLRVEGSNLVMDLSQGLSHEMPLGNSDIEHQRGAKILRQMFSGLEVGLARVPLLSLSNKRDDAFRQPVDIKVGTQSGAKQQAVVLFTTFQHGAAGFSPPAGGNDFPTLLMEGTDQQNSCAILLSRRLLCRTVYGPAVLGMFPTGTFSYSNGDDDRQSIMQVEQGVLQVPGASMHLETGDYEFSSFNLDVGQSEGAFRIDFGAAGVTQRWQPTYSVMCRYRQLGEPDWRSETITAAPDLTYTFVLQGDASVEGKLKGRLDMQLSASGEAQHTAVDSMNYAINRSIINALAQKLTAHAIEPLNASLTLPGPGLFKPNLYRLPNGVALWGSVAPDQSLRIVEDDVQVAAGQTQQFTVMPEPSVIEWRVAALGEYTGAVGVIDSRTGLYQAPDADELKGNTVPVCVTATDAANGQTSEVLMIVHGHALAITPRFRLVAPGQGYELQVTSLGDTDIEWSIKNLQGGLRGSLNVIAPGRAQYVAHEAQNDVFYVLDEIQVLSTITGAVSTAHVLVRHDHGQMVLIPDPYEGVPGRPMRLTAWDTAWGVQVPATCTLHGPGRIENELNGEGLLYYPDLESGERSVLIMGRLEDQYGVIEGHLTLALPLSQGVKQHVPQASIMQRERQHSLAPRRRMP